MTMTDPISDLLTRIRNGQMVRKSKIACPASKIKVAILKVLQEEGFIRGFEVTEDEKGKQLEISVKTMPSYKNNMGITILSTSKGVMTNFAAKNANLGGEILCRIY